VHVELEVEVSHFADSLFLRDGVAVHQVPCSDQCVFQ
jgi:hypothetical protein